MKELNKSQLSAHRAQTLPAQALQFSPQIWTWLPALGQQIFSG
jgi:hypothetical protein